MEPLPTPPLPERTHDTRTDRLHDAFKALQSGLSREIVGQALLIERL